MADVKWIKIVTDIFDDEKMLLIESLPSADSIIVIWFKLLCLAGKNNNNGVFIMSDKIAYTDEMLATIFRRDVNTVRLALKTFEAYGMIEIVDGVITIPNWGKHQTLDKIEKKTAYMKEYMRDYREKQKEKIESKSLCQNGLSIDEWYEVLKYFNHKCAYCGENNDSLEQEHIIPVNKGGTYCIGNIIPACRHCNSSKGKKDFGKWYKSYELYSDERYKKILDYMCKTNVSDLRKSNVSEADIDKEEDKDKKDKDLDKEKDKDKKTNNVQNELKKADANALFEKLWKLYRVKKGKGQVSDTAKMRLLKIGEEELLRAIERYNTELEKDSGWRRPQNGSTFFNSGYVDYLDANYVPSEKQKKKSYSGISKQLAEETERNINSRNEDGDSDFY